MNKKPARIFLSQVVLFACYGMLLASCANSNILGRNAASSSTMLPTETPVKANDNNPPLKLSTPLKPAQPALTESSISQLPDPASTIFFLPGSSTVSNANNSIAVINAFADKLKNAARSTVLLIGHADDLAGKEYCIALSGKRIAVVENELIKRGVRQTQIRGRPLGKESLLSANCVSKLCLQANRSVELQFSE